MVCFIWSDSNGVRRGKGRCEGDAVRAMQQLARMYHEVPEKLTPEEKEYIETLIDRQRSVSMSVINADPVKMDSIRK